MLQDSTTSLDNSTISLDNDIITHPAHYVEGRVFEPIAVIEAFGLCHHLSCVVKYVSRAGRKTSLINDLCKAHWYLDREIARLKTGVGYCNPTFVELPSLRILDICEDWNLSPNLEEVLSFILHYRLATASHQRFQWIRRLFESSDSKESYGGGDYLVKAREYLRLEIAAHSEENIDDSDQGGGK